MKLKRNKKKKRSVFKGRKQEGRIERRNKRGDKVAAEELIKLKKKIRENRTNKYNNK